MLLLRTSRGVDPGIPLLRSLGSNAHVWLPGANGVSVASLPSNNYLLSDGSTGYSTVDGVDGLGLDGMGSLGSELVAGNNLSTATVTGSCVKNSNTQFTLSANTIANRISIALPLIVAPAAVFHTVRLKADKACTILAANLWSVSKALALTMSYQTFEFVLADGTAPHSQNLSFYTTADSPVVVDVEYVSSKQYSGIHLTQATTANKPLVRRGMLNELAYSNAPSNAVWGKISTSVSGSLVTATASTYVSVFQTATTVSGTPYTLAAIVSPGNQNSVSLEIRGAGTTPDAVFNAATGALTSGSGTSVLMPDGRYLVAMNEAANSVTTYGIIGISGAAATSGQTINIHSVMLTPGTWTAAQILAEGGIPTTTATAASNPTSGKYWWSFDGGNDSLAVASVPYQVTDDHCVTLVARRETLTSFRDVFSVGGATSTPFLTLLETDNGTTTVYAGWRSDAAVAVTLTSTWAAGEVAVWTMRQVGNTRVLRKNGVQVATNTTALGTTTVTQTGIGIAFGGATYFNGAIGWVVPLKATMSDADCLTVERLVSSQFPNGPVF